MKEEGWRLLEGLPRPIICDIGSGNHPFPLANLLVDLYPDTNDHRERGKPLTRDGRRFIRADVQDLPFPDKSIDFIWCAEVLEHCERPVQAFNEIKRVALHAYVLVPTMSREVLCSRRDPEGWKTHRWYVWLDGSNLEFTPKSESEAERIRVGQAEHVVIHVQPEEREESETQRLPDCA